MDKHIIKLKSSQSENVMIKNEIVYFVKNKEGWQITIPEQIASKLTIETHTAFGHSGRYKTYHMLKEICTFRNMHKIVIDTIRKCDE